MPTIHGAAQHGPTPPEMPKRQGRSSVEGCTATVHGDRVAYDTYRCRCPEARADSTRGRKDRAARQLRGGRGLTPSIGTARRLRALSSIGWNIHALAGHVGCSGQRIAQLRAADTDHVNTATHTTIAALYERLSDRPGPSRRARTHAAKQGWLPPIWWDDDTLDDPTYHPAVTEPARPQLYDVDPVNVDRAITGQTVTLTRGERLEVIRHLHAHGHGYRKIADRLGIAQRQVHRDLTDLGLIDQEAGAA